MSAITPGRNLCNKKGGHNARLRDKKINDGLRLARNISEVPETLPVSIFHHTTIPRRQ